ncbi:MAG: hypothetical protein GTO51_09725 [Candidatus Latescibacteria bacterium]|nr:hypothetical protein [Candidatus Latescibacterota bacterium]NIM22208.1 hypothetical protein [Candidatus Latescibacterota bacterium]NIM66247.1 hypothetical protein [Candidatus Latescibacterota bacterium]NIO02324.1 hypothetical protein [Candidatus Latescibacterota bacterium]NIO29855.1 hypothetical protein [Candidatus Latescibacterota bacterium]
MKKYLVLLLCVAVLTAAGCKKPDLVVQDVHVDFDANTVTIRVGNVGDANAGEHLTYIEINRVSASDAAKPETQYSANVSSVPVGTAWDSGPIPFSKFSPRRGSTIDLGSLTEANVVVRADAKGMVDEKNENNNVYDANH